MSTTVQYTQHFPAPPDAVWQMLTDVEYIRTKGLRSGSLEVNPDVELRDGETIIISRRKMPAKMPAFMKKFVGEVLILNETQKWGAAQPDGSRTGSFVIDFGGQPMAFHGTLELRPNGPGTAVVTDGDLRSPLPVVGRKAESVAKDWSERYLRKEEQVAGDWLAAG